MSVMFLAVWAAAVAPVASQPAALPIPDAPALVRMCSPEGAMQFRFGQTGVPGSSKLEATLGRGFGLPAAMAPFASAQPRATEWSGRLMEITYSARLAKTEGEALIPRLADALAGAGWTPADMAEGQQPLYLMAYGGGRTFARPIADGDKPTRVMAHLDYALGELTLTCGRDDLLRAHAGEAFGDLPAGTPRPSLPEIALPPVAVAQDCEDPARLEAVAATMTDVFTDSFLGRMVARTTWRDRLTTWMAWKLESSGKVSKDRMLTLLLSSTGKASPQGNPFATLAMIPELLTLVERLSDAEKAKDRKGFCRGVLDFREWVTKVDAITMAQTRSALAAMTAEAAKLSISLD